jgi:hypothetical protein
VSIAAPVTSARDSCICAPYPLVEEALLIELDEAVPISGEW